MTKHGTGDELWDEFVREYEKQHAPHEPSAAERATAGPRRRRRWPWIVLAGCLVLGAVGAYRFSPWRPARAAAVAVNSAKPTARADAAAKANTAAVAVTPAQAFPAAIAGYTRVADVADRSCTGADSVGPTLAGLITQGHGCLGLDFGLYKDSLNNEYDLAVFTMKDPVDAISIVSTLSADPTNYQVAVQVPPTGSGLRSLPADSGLVQAFTSYGHLVVVGMAQWSDGHSTDFQRLENQLSPLLTAVAKQAESHDHG
ncbi:hypothetical protein ABIA33_001109 [Streptacidiphilus sp. MAP12-16]|uniref:hypothetical protein n=1 Tax=Streptacidiphilus sp. MAP12-16 TaxID=3156300 RepID=UPI00351398FB